MLTIRATSVIGIALAIGFAAAPARAGNPCIGDAKETFTDCKGDCKEGYQAAKDACLQRDHDCVGRRDAKLEEMLRSHGRGAGGGDGLRQQDAGPTRRLQSPSR